MDSTTHITCPGCNKKYSRPAVSGPKNVRCKQCNTSFTITPAEVEVAEVVELFPSAAPQPQTDSLFGSDPQPQSLFPSAPEAGHAPAPSYPPQTPAYQAQPTAYSPGHSYQQKRSTPGSSDSKMVWILGAVLALTFVVALVVAGLIWFWYSLSNKPNIARNNGGDPANQQTTNTGQPAVTTPVSNSSVAYNFKDGYKYRYGYDFEFEAGPRKFSIFGTNTLEKDNRGRRTQLSYSGYAHQNELTPSYIGSFNNDSQNFEGKLALDAQGQPSAETVQIQGRQLPLLMVSLPHVGIEPLPPAGQKNWEVRQTIASVIPNLDDALQGGSARGNIDPYTGLPRTPSMRTAEDIINRSRRGMRGGTRGIGRSPIRDPLGAIPGTRGGPRDENPELLSCTLLQVTRYRVISEDSSTIRVAKEIKITTQASEDGAPGQTTNSKGHYVFDKSKQCVTELKMEGQTEIDLNNITLKIPHKFNFKLDRIATQAELRAEYLKRQEEAKKRLEEQQERVANRERSDTPSTSSTRTPTRVDATVSEPEPLPQNVAASFGKISWGLGAMAFCPNNNFLICGHSDRKLSVYDIERGRRVEMIEDLRDLGQIKAIAISDDGSRVLTGGYSGRIIIWSIDDRGLLDRVGQFEGHSTEIKSIAIDPTGTYVISGDREKAARLWNMETQREINVSRDFDYQVVGTGFTDGGATAVACCRENVVFFDVETGEVTRKEKDYRRGSAHDIAFSPDGSQFAVSDGYEIQLFETETQKQIGAMKAGNTINWVLQYSGDGKHIISGQSAVSIWEVDSLSHVGEIKVGQHLNVQAIAISPNSSLISGYGSSSQDLKVFHSPVSTSSPDENADGDDSED